VSDILAHCGARHCTDADPSQAQPSRPARAPPGPLNGAVGSPWAVRWNSRETRQPWAFALRPRHPGRPAARRAPPSQAWRWALRRPARAPLRPARAKQASTMNSNPLCSQPSYSPGDVLWHRL